MIQPFNSRLEQPLQTVLPHTLQVNLGKLCNQACRHCHVDAGPKRTEIMDLETVKQVIEAVDHLNVDTVDITGGAPEMNPHFRYLVQQLRQRDVRVMDRCNLTILLEPGQADLAAFLAGNQVEVVASLPFYLEDNVDRQRGRGVFGKSIEGMRLLNQHGYGKGLKLDLVYNPQGAYLPPDQMEMEKIYKRELGGMGIVFDNLYTITNMPISRFREFLIKSNNFNRYMKKLAGGFNPATLNGLMCRSLISVGWDGLLYDCDFNQMLELPIIDQHRHIKDIKRIKLNSRNIAVADHCYGCTAGGGSSCGGSLDKVENGVALAV